MISSRSVPAPSAARAGRTAGGGAPSPALRAAADPCLSCTLPDCDETSWRCGLKTACRTYNLALRHGLPVSADTLAGVAAYHRAWKTARRAERSEQRA